jgi:DNA-binding CsgD family transcriptional regulator
VSHCPGFLDSTQWSSVCARLRLSPQESEVVALSLDGNSVGRIGAALGLSPNTVRTYIKRIYGKAEVRTRYDLLLLIVTTCVTGDVRNQRTAS